MRRVIADVSPPARVAELDEAESFDSELHLALGAIDVLRLGLGEGDVQDQLVVIEELGAGPTSMAAFLISHYAAVGLLLSFGGPEELIDAAFRGAARRNDRWEVTGTKLWTSGAREADALIVFARTSPIERSPADGITMFLVPRDAPGLSVQALRTFGIHGMSTCEVPFEEVPATVLGPLDGGLRAAFASIGGEGLHAAAACLGAGRGALEAARGLLWRAAEIETGGGDSSTLAAMAKLAASEAAVTITLRGMQLLGLPRSY